MREEEASPSPSEGGEQAIEENDVKRSPPSEGLGGGFNITLCDTLPSFGGDGGGFNMTHSPPSEGLGEAFFSIWQN